MRMAVGLIYFILADLIYISFFILFRSDVDRKCLKCSSGYYFDLSKEVKDRGCIVCPNDKGFSKLTKGTEGECFTCPSCADCEDETKICKKCQEGKRVMMPLNQTCEDCDTKSFTFKGLDHCIELPFIKNSTLVEYNNGNKNKFSSPFSAERSIQYKKLFFF
jgi:hypothetical protein